MPITSSFDGPSLEERPDLTNSISPLLVIAGPTAAGKSALAMHLAERYEGEIVNGDSLQIYRGMDIGTAKPTQEERQQIAHHLFDVRNPDEVFTAGEYCRMGRAALAEIRSRGKLAIVVGGAGFYLKALLEGLSPSPTRSEELRSRLLEIEKRRAGSLHRILRCWDKAASARIHSNDTNKLIRAIEIMRQAQKNLSAVHAIESQKLEGFRVLWIGLDPPREALRARIAERSEAMFAAGLLEEVRALQAQGYGAEAKAMESVGYKQAHAVLAGRLSVTEAMADTTLRTRQYAKRQMTWFRKTEEINWLQGFGNDAAIQAQAESLLQQFLTDPIKKSFR